MTSKFSVLGLALCLFSTSQGAALENHCQATSNWPGWVGLKNAFVFGDSYSTTGFNASGIQPTPTNPLGNPTYPGYTSSNGPNWVDYLTVKYNSSTLLTYNLAHGGATISSALVAPYDPQVSSVADQIQNQWFPVYAGSPASTPWSSNNTLFAIFDGINDIGYTWYLGTDATKVLHAKIFAVYRGLVDSLYYAGGRNFAFLSVPPFDRAPMALAQPATDQAAQKAAISAWNSALTEMINAVKDEKPEANIFLVDANKYFTQVLDNPKTYNQTAGYKNTTAYCVAYEK
ncbi:hypothetical protein QTJ16_003942 [Diplocarpon rosae]|uniref:Carbohydrate esterase family 16 protein n=1 Tax=Diplocarpon rosae TaxID=946125 RepID=A0AAD9T159_9HELO|nr:hypothetical protein QTJ16_003942 [Diplocarpon rosae]